jgi:RNA polymerase sigma-70 factor (ECF subfamily)
MQDELVVRAQHGDVEAFSSLTAGRMPELYGIARLILRDEDRAADAVQDALVRAWLDLRGIRDPSRFDAWLRRLLIRACYRAAGRYRRRMRVELELSPVIQPAVRDHTGDLALAEQLEKGFRHLSTDHRTVLVLVYYVGLTMAEAAEIIGVPLGTVQSRLSRATRAMRAALEADERAAEFAAGAVR